MPEKALKTSQNTLLYSKKAIVLENNNNRREINNNDLKTRSDNNISDRITKFAGKIEKKESIEYLFHFLFI